MKIIDHGVWVKYTPDRRQIKMDAPANAVFVQRESDGVDWYDYVRPNFFLLHPRPTTLPEYEPPGEPNFTPGSLICNVYHHKHFNVHIIGTATRDPTAVLPINQRVIEIVGHTGTDPHAEFGGKVYDHERQAFRDLVLPQTLLPDRIGELEKRIEQLERKANG